MRQVWPLLPLVLLLFTLLANRMTADGSGELLGRARKVLAQIEGEIGVPGLREPVEVLRDRHGVPHIYARNADDLFFAQGFVTAQDRLFQMDWWRRMATGETAAVIGKRGLDADRLARLIRYRGDMMEEWTSYSPDTQQIATAFTRGINAWIDHIGDRLPIEFQEAGYQPGRWKPEDVLGRMAGLTMIRNFLYEVDRAELVATVGIEKARRLAPTDPPTDYAPVPGMDLAGINRQSLLAAYTAATSPLRFTGDADGSNNWVVDGTLSESGKPLLASDPHRSLTLPSLRYLVHLVGPGWNVIGSGEPALPGIAIGHNERIAWGFTIVGTDQSDLYVEETDPNDPTRYRVGAGWESMTVARESITVRGEKEPVEVELRFTRHGPVLHQDLESKRAYALRWVGALPGTAGYLGALAISRANNWNEFRDAMKAWKLPSENMVYADVDGHIGWIAACQTPVRNGWDGVLPVSGASGKYEWERFLDVRELPQAYDPPSHFLVTANHNIRPVNYPHRISFEWSPPFRHDRLRGLLEAKKRFSLRDFQAMQHDVTTLPGQRLAKLAARLDPENARERELAEMLKRWDGVLSANSRGGAIYAVWLAELLNAFFQPHAASPDVLNFLKAGHGMTVLLDALDRPDRAWFGADAESGRDRLLRSTFTLAVARLEQLLPGNPADAFWGRLHTATFEHPLASRSKDHAAAFNLGPVERGGDGNTPHNARHDERFRQIHGASYRQIFDLADWDRGRVTSTPGQSGQLGSPHYDDLLPLWARGEYFPLPYSRASVEAETRNRLILRPAQP